MVLLTSYKQPFQFHHSFPLVVLCPDIARHVVVQRSEHLCHSTEMPTRIHREEEINWTLLCALLVCLIQPVITERGGTPYLKLDTLEDIVLRK